MSDNTKLRLQVRLRAYLHGILQPQFKGDRQRFGRCRRGDKIFGDVSTGSAVRKHAAIAAGNRSEIKRKQIWRVSSGVKIMRMVRFVANPLFGLVRGVLGAQALATALVLSAGGRVTIERAGPASAFTDTLSVSVAPPQQIAAAI